MWHKKFCQIVKAISRISNMWASEEQSFIDVLFLRYFSKLVYKYEEAQTLFTFFREIRFFFSLNCHCTTDKTISPERFWAKYSYPCEYALLFQYRNMKVLWHLWWYSKHSGALSSNSHDLKSRSNSSEDESWPFSFFYVSFKKYILVEMSPDKDFCLQMPSYLEFDEKLLTISDTTFRQVRV